MPLNRRRPVGDIPIARGGKRFVNETGAYLQVTLVVRSGNNPSKPPFKTLPFEMEKGQKLVIQYGDRNNPYLNEISVKALVDGGAKWAGELAITPDSDIDVQLNDNETATFKYTNRVLSLEMTVNRVRTRSLAAKPACFDFTMLNGDSP